MLRKKVQINEREKNVCVGGEHGKIEMWNVIENVNVIEQFSKLYLRANVETSSPLT